MKIELQFNEGDKIFFIHDKKCLDSTVRGVKIEILNGKKEVTYLCRKDNDVDKLVHLKVKEEDAFKSKEELLNSL